MSHPSTNHAQKRHSKGSRLQPKFKRPSAPEEIDSLNARIIDETPSRGTSPYAKNAVVSFSSQPLSQATLQGLESNGYTTMTAIQSGSIPHALAGRDILGSAKTGSGKSLAFLVPLLELLYRKGWAPQDGVGAIVLSPTRELAGQLFAVLRKIGRNHSFSLGLLMGGQNKNREKFEKNDFVREQQAIPTTNILISTPGRLLQHLEQTPYFNVDSLQILVLDEADRILDMGFRDQLVRILEYLPPGEARQTMLFSATQTSSIKDLATLSINHRTVEYVGVHDQDAETTPDRLKQAYVLVPVEHKLNCLYSFLKSHLKCKTIVFFATCSQVRHAWDLFCRLRPGLSVLAIHGKLSQNKRLQVYDKFTTTSHSVLFATDVASRGLDFPLVDWVVQVDAPEDYDMYIHRVGRTARFQQSGQALLLLDPEEERWFVQDNQGAQQKKLKAPLRKKSINPTKTVLVSQRAASLVAEHLNLYALAKKAFWSYVRSLSLLPKDGIWSNLQIKNMHLEEYALSLGLSKIPGDLDQALNHVASREGLRETKNVNRKLQKLKEQIRLEKDKKRKREIESKEDTANSVNLEKDSADDLLLLKSRHVTKDVETISKETTQIRKPKKIRIHGSNSTDSRHIKFEEDGTEQPTLLEAKLENFISADDGALQNATDDYLKRVQQRLETTKELDKEEERERIRAKHRKKRLQEKPERAEGKDDAKSVSHTSVLQGSDRREESEEESISSSESSLPSSDSCVSDAGEQVGTSNEFARHEDFALSLIRGQAHMN